MECPYFTVTNYSAFDSGAYSCKKPKSEKVISAYEFELYLQDCQGGLQIDGVFYQARKGYFSCTKPGQRQRMVLPYKCYFFNICTQDESLCELLDRLPNYGALWNMEEIATVFRQMLEIESTASLENMLMVESYVCRLISLIVKGRYAATEGCTEGALLHRHQLQRADRYIREHYSENITLEILAAQCGLHPNYFHRLYTAAYGHTPAQRLHSCRITAAKIALLTQNSSMSEIAAVCGFSSQTYFGYKFKEATGDTPLQYRKKRRGRR